MVLLIDKFKRSERVAEFLVSDLIVSTNKNDLFKVNLNYYRGYSVGCSGMSIPRKSGHYLIYF